MDINNPNDTSFVFGGFTPISIRLIEQALKKGLNSIQKDILKNLGTDIIIPNDEKPIINPINDNNFILLVFTGGITYSEIEAIRFLNKIPEFSKYKFLIITTNIINAKSFFDEIKDDKIDKMSDNDEIKKKIDLNEIIFKEDEKEKDKEKERKKGNDKKDKNEIKKSNTSKDKKKKKDK